MCLPLSAASGDDLLTNEAGAAHLFSQGDHCYWLRGFPGLYSPLDGIATIKHEREQLLLLLRTVIDRRSTELIHESSVTVLAYTHGSSVT